MRLLRTSETHDEVAANERDGVFDICGGIVSLDEFQSSDEAKVARFLGEEPVGRIKFTNLFLEKFHGLKEVGATLKLEIEEGHLNAPGPHP